MDTSPLVRRFGDLRLTDRPTVGGKGASLGELTFAGAPVPPGYVVTTAAFEAFLHVLDPGGEIRARVEALEAEDIEAIAHATAPVRERIEAAELPEEIAAAIRDHYRDLDSESDTPGEPAPVAVRSSATSEDAEDASFAGLQDTYLWVRGEDSLVEHVRRCWASLYSVESVSYRRRLGLPEQDLAMAVVVQRMIDPRCAGVMFTRSPLTGDRSVVALEGSWGLGSALVSGDVTPDKYVVGKVTGDICSRTVSAKLRQHRMDPSGAGVVEEDVPEYLRSEPCLSDTEIHELVRIGRQVESHYGTPQDIEWAISRNLVPGHNIFLLQSRPETVWANREKAPTAAPKARAFDHVLSLLGGAGKGGGTP
ncbi:PEP/pyruvate-binding domain-containing protein [Streptomyces sp. NBC_01275]|uniref:PEP/pyruvate-binding domain-containing protein n=1 Tax=Streptomyces sp. NBC_01275 TaxID=2903807 RepID=UPI00225929CC|nr:PEP/pyruvate-binding domain-containing protein [Streptomyces sp. NBC_01275]MCX4759690.1 PEP/pyruvate-binding domain-containing protein [Streptomyces sp. NBC_01275]